MCFNWNCDPYYNHCDARVANYINVRRCWGFYNFRDLGMPFQVVFCHVFQKLGRLAQRTAERLWNDNTWNITCYTWTLWWCVRPIWTQASSLQSTSDFQQVSLDTYICRSILFIYLKLEWHALYWTELLQRWSRRCSTTWWLSHNMKKLTWLQYWRAILYNAGLPVFWLSLFCLLYYCKLCCILV